jgi:transcriptional regulator with PAS, ATPase and Fis domain
MEPMIGMVSSSSNLAELARRVARKVGIQVEVHIGILERAISIGKDLEARGFEVILSRGGTAAILKDNLSIPVLSIPLSAFDLLENVLEAARHGKKIGISVYRDRITGVEIFERLFHVEIKQIIYTTSEKLRAGIQDAKSEGMEVIIGGNLSYEIARQIGLPCMLITSSEETVANMIQEARVVASIRREEKEKMRRMEAILNAVSEGMVAIDKNGTVTIFNKVAEDILGIKGALGSQIDEVVPQLGLCEVLTTGLERLQHLQQVGNAQIVVNLVAVYLGEEVIGAIASFSDVSKLMRAEQKVRKTFVRGFVAKHTIAEIACESQAMKRVIDQVKRFARSDSTLLITGESGTGKELVAHSIHNLSPRRKEPFVTINCSALPEGLLESELFGHEEGAFTGARKGGKMGLFELAHRGTIFLDEIGSISEAIQSRLLRVLEQKEVMRIGGDRLIPIDVRIIAATNKDLLTEVAEDRMRMDLYFRLNILKIHIPPLRERKEDIPSLVVSLFDSHAKQYGTKLGPLPGRLLKRFSEYSWPGNIRELENFTERLVLMVEKPTRVQLEVVLNNLFEEFFETERVLSKGDYASISSRESNLKVVGAGGRYTKGEVAKKLGISRTTLWRRLKHRDLDER